MPLCGLFLVVLLFFLFLFFLFAFVVVSVFVRSFIASCFTLRVGHRFLEVIACTRLRSGVEVIIALFILAAAVFLFRARVLLPDIV